MWTLATGLAPVLISSSKARGLPNAAAEDARYRNQCFPDFEVHISVLQAASWPNKASSSSSLSMSEPGTPSLS